MKTLARIAGATMFCFSAVQAGTGQTQPAVLGEVPEGNAAEDLPAVWHGASTGPGDLIVLREDEYSNLYNVDTMNNPAKDLLTIDGNEIPISNQSMRQATAHPAYSGLDHTHPAHQDVANSLDGVIDSCSLTCLSCHDGINAAETRVKTVGEWEILFDFGNISHPLGVDYDQASFRKSGLKPAVFLPSEIVLPEGKVGCESCHNLHSTLPHFLVSSNLDNALCIGCHVK
jgi:predicted CXXCH cytochrome family protein